MSRVLMAALLSALCLAATAFPGSANAAAGWERLGTRIVDFGGDKDTIVVGRDEGAFRSIMFEVDGGAVEMRNVEVVFGNGRPFSPPTQLVFSDKERSRVIDLPGAARFIRSVTFTYRSLRTGQGRATITLYGH